MNYINKGGINMFLSASTTVNLSSIIGAVIILAILGFAVWYRFKTHPSKGDKRAAEEFLNGLADNIYAIMTKIINDTDLTKYKNINELESDILKQIYDQAYAYIESQLKKASEDDILSALVLKVLDKDTIYSFIDKMINDKNIKSTISNIWGANEIAKNSNRVEAEDKELSDKYSDQSQYVEDLDVNELPPVEAKEPTKEETEALNPPKDEEEDYNPDDVSMEIVDDIVFTDKQGRKRSKKTGRYVKDN